MACRLALLAGRWLLACALIAGLGGCAHPGLSSVEREQLALPHRGFVPVRTPGQIKAWLKRDPDGPGPMTSTVLQVYLEGDGAPWWAQRVPPTDPTPRSSVALPLALGETHAPVAYLARPCQFLSALDRSSCPVEWWTSARWSEPVIALTEQALDVLLQVSGARELVLTGHSGGGTLALLVAARRQDVRCVLTVASPLDVQAWTQGHGVTPLHGGGNPADVPVTSLTFQSRHLMGMEDRVVPATAVGRYGARLQPGQIVSVPALGHLQGWVSWWRAPGDEQARLSAWLQGCLKPI